jgi:hypothetical protein
MQACYIIHDKLINISSYRKSTEATEIFCLSLFLTKYRLARSKYAAYVPKTKITCIGKLFDFYIQSNSVITNNSGPEEFIRYNRGSL